MRTQQEAPACCGQPMSWREVFGIRVWACQYRNHPRIYENLYTGQRVSEDDLERQR